MLVYSRCLYICPCSRTTYTLLPGWYDFSFLVWNSYFLAILVWKWYEFTLKSMNFSILGETYDKRLIIMVSNYPLFYQLPSVLPVNKMRFVWSRYRYDFSPKIPDFGMKKVWFTTEIWYENGMIFSHFGMKSILAAVDTRY